MGVPDLRGHSSEAHDCIVLDELSPHFAIQLKKLLQASNEVVTLGSSPTMSHSYQVHVHRCMIIVCSNVWAAEMAAIPLHHRNWLADNSVVVEIAQEMFEK